MSHSILVRQYFSLLNQSIANSTSLFSVTVSTASDSSEDLTVLQQDSIRI